MILVINVCKDELSFDEFVLPIVGIIKDKCSYEIMHYKKIDNDFDIAKYNQIIICGTNLQDDEYLDNLDRFWWIKDFKGHILGICAGMQVIALLYGARLVKGNEIGMTKINVRNKFMGIADDFEAYSLHNNYVVDWDFKVLAVSDKCIQVIKKDNLFGVLFHPEVRNERIIEKFISLR